MKVAILEVKNEKGEETLYYGLINKFGVFVEIGDDFDDYEEAKRAMTEVDKDPVLLQLNDNTIDNVLSFVDISWATDFYEKRANLITWATNVYEMLRSGARYERIPGTFIVGNRTWFHRETLARWIDYKRSVTPGIDPRERGEEK